MKLRNGLVFSIIAVLVIGVTINAAGAATLPNWIKGVAGWWSQDKISEKEFMDGIEYLINSGAIKPKIIQEKEAKIQQLEAKLAEYESKPIVAQTYPELRESTKLWVDKEIPDHVYFKQVQSLVDRGIIGPFEGKQTVGTNNVKNKATESFREVAWSWLQSGMEDSSFMSYVEGLMQVGLFNNPKGYVAPEPQKTAAQLEVDEQQAKQAAADASHARLLSNAKEWVYGYISTETYLENIVALSESGDFEPFKRGGFVYNSDNIVTSKAIQNILNDKFLTDALKQSSEVFVTNPTTTQYTSDIFTIFSSS